MTRVQKYEIITMRTFHFKVFYKPVWQTGMCTCHQHVIDVCIIKCILLLQMMWGEKWFFLKLCWDWKWFVILIPNSSRIFFFFSIFCTWLSEIDKDTFFTSMFWNSSQPEILVHKHISIPKAHFAFIIHFLLVCIDLHDILFISWRFTKDFI